MVNAESRASSFATLIAGLSMSARAPRFDAVAANAPVGLQGCEQETELLFHRARQEPAHAVLLPVRRLHHFCDAGPLRLAQQCEHALLLGHSLRPWFVSLPQRLGGGDSLGLRFNRSRRFLGVGSRDVTFRRDAVFDWPLPFLGAALFVFRDFMERVDIVWAPLVRGVGIDARTTQSPAN